MKILKPETLAIAVYTDVLVDAVGTFLARFGSNKDWEKDGNRNALPITRKDVQEMRNAFELLMQVRRAK